MPTAPSVPTAAPRPFCGEGLGWGTATQAPARGQNLTEASAPLLWILGQERPRNGLTFPM